MLEGGGTIVQETRLYDPDRNETRAMRTKEEANDYRYFPDPDLLPVEVDKALIDAVAATLPELPDAKLRAVHAGIPIAGLRRRCSNGTKGARGLFRRSRRGDDSRREDRRKLGDRRAHGRAESRRARDQRFAGDARRISRALLDKIADGTISGKIAKDVFEAMWQGEGTVRAIIEERGLVQISDSASIEALVDRAIAANPTQVEQYRAGKQQVLGFFVGQVMKASGGKANPAAVNAALRKKLGAA